MAHPWEHTLEPFLAGLAFPEAPRWHDGRLYFSDMDDNRVASAGLDGHVETVTEVASRPSGLGWLPDGSLLVVSMHDRCVLRLSDDGLTVHSDLSALAAFHCNDMWVDALGRAYVGSFGWDPRGDGPERPTPLILVMPGGSATFTGDELAFPNGIGLTADGHTLVVAESRGARLSAFSVADDGQLRDRRVLADLGESFPDGICVDAEGGVWAATIFENEVIRVGPDGTVTDRVSTSPLHAYACALGGPDGRSLFVCSASTSEPGDAARLRHGRIGVAHVEVPGAGRA
ncbi:MAG: SMP-30/gluconolactonase/LRE family protein [Acidimicrobiales bacterium]|nr:SMP-30/gluconolactonase/LRE family protein [Acidimicrobiales bacterium]